MEWLKICQISQNNNNSQNNNDSQNNNNSSPEKQNEFNKTMMENHNNSIKIQNYTNSNKLNTSKNQTITTPSTYIEANINNIIVNMTLNDQNLTQQKLDFPIISLNTSNFMNAEILNQDSFKNLTLFKNNPIPFIIHTKCIAYGNTTMEVLIPFKNPENNNPDDLCNNFTFIKECYPPNFGLNIYSKYPNSSKLSGDIINDDLLNNTFFLTIGRNVSRFFLYMIAKNIVFEAQYTLIGSLYSSNEKIGSGHLKEEELTLSALKNKNFFEIDFDCSKNGSFLSYMRVDVKGFRRYSFIFKKECKETENSFFGGFLKSKYLIWMFFGSIFVVLFVLLLISSLRIKSTAQGRDPPIEPNALALSIIYDLKFSRRLRKKFGIQKN